MRLKGNFKAEINEVKTLGIIAVFYMVLRLFGVTCPIKYLTGISCMGCGMTRAVFSAVRLQFEEAFYYHPLFLLVPVALLIIVNRGRIKYFKEIMVLFVLTFLVVYGYRLLYMDTDIVVFEPCEGAIVKLINQILFR